MWCRAAGGSGWMAVGASSSILSFFHAWLLFSKSWTLGGAWRATGPRAPGAPSPRGEGLPCRSRSSKSAPSRRRLPQRLPCFSVAHPALLSIGGKRGVRSVLRKENNMGVAPTVSEALKRGNGERGGTHRRRVPCDDSREWPRVEGRVAYPARRRNGSRLT
jgi:hypothetical protein